MTTWNALLGAGLVDELHLLVGAGVLIEGDPAFSTRPAGPLHLLEARQLGGSDLALLRYSVGPAATPS
jgi:hypothetical protein